MSDSATPWIAAARPPWPSPTPGVHPNSCPSSQWCHPAISSSVVPFSSCPQSLSASQSFPMSQLFSWGGQSTGVSALASFLPKKSQGWSPSEWTYIILISSVQHNTSVFLSTGFPIIWKERLPWSGLKRKSSYLRAHFADTCTKWIEIRHRCSHSSQLGQLDVEMLRVVPREGAWWCHSHHLGCLLFL